MKKTSSTDYDSRERVLKTNRAVLDRYNDREESWKVRTYVTSGENYDDICEKLAPDFEFVFGPDWKDKLRIPNSPIWYVSSSYIPRRGTHEYWTIQLLTAMNGKISEDVRSGFELDSTVYKYYPESRENNETIKFVQRIERRLIDAGVAEARFVLDPGGQHFPPPRLRLEAQCFPECARDPKARLWSDYVPPVAEGERAYDVIIKYDTSIIGVSLFDEFGTGEIVYDCPWTILKGVSKKYAEFIKCHLNCVSAVEINSDLYVEIRPSLRASTKDENEAKKYLEENFAEACDTYKEDLSYILGDKWIEKADNQEIFDCLYHLVLADKGVIDGEEHDSGYYIDSVRKSKKKIKLIRCIEKHLIDYSYENKNIRFVYDGESHIKLNSRIPERKCRHALWDEYDPNVKWNSKFPVQSITSWGLTIASLICCVIIVVMHWVTYEYRGSIGEEDFEWYYCDPDILFLISLLAVVCGIVPVFIKEKNASTKIRGTWSEDILYLKGMLSIAGIYLPVIAMGSIILNEDMYYGGGLDYTWGDIIVGLSFFAFPFLTLLKLLDRAYENRSRIALIVEFAVMAIWHLVIMAQISGMD